jgi:hypothetical protein
MKFLFGFLLLGLLHLEAAPPPTDCGEWARKAEQTFLKMDEALKLKTGMLLGEMETAKGALEGCIEQNKAVETRMSMVWALTDMGLLALLGLMVLHQVRMNRAVQLLSRLLQSKDPSHGVRYAPSQGLYWASVAVLVVTFTLINLIALVS